MDYSNFFASRTLLLVLTCAFVSTCRERTTSSLEQNDPNVNRYPPKMICDMAKPALTKELAPWSGSVKVIGLTNRPDLCRFQVAFRQDSELLAYIQAATTRNIDAIHREYIVGSSVYSITLILLSEEQGSCKGMHLFKVPEENAECNAAYEVAKTSDILGLKDQPSFDQLNAAWTKIELTMIDLDSIDTRCAAQLNFASQKDWLNKFLLPRRQHGSPLTLMQDPVTKACIPFFTDFFSTFTPISRASISN